MRAKLQQSEEEYYTMCEGQDFSDFRGRPEVIVSAVAAEGQPPSDLSSDGSSLDSTGGRPKRLPPRGSQSHSDESDDSVRIRVLPGHPRAERLDQEQLHNRKSQGFIERWSAIVRIKERVEELEKVIKKLEKEAAIAKQEVVRLTGVVGEAPKTSTQAVEESKRHAQGATSLQDCLDALTSERLEEHGEVREPRQQATPHRGDVKPAAPSGSVPTAGEMELSVTNAPDDQESGISQSSAAPFARSGRVSSTPPRAPPPRGYQAVPPAAGYQWVRVQGKWQRERLLRIQEPQGNPRSANRNEELQRYRLEEEDDDIDVSDCSQVSLEDMMDQEFEGLAPPYTELEEERDMAHDMNIHAVGTQAAYGRDRERYGPRRDWELRG